MASSDDIRWRRLSKYKALWNHPPKSWVTDKVTVKSVAIRSSYPLEDYEIQKNVAEELEHIIKDLERYNYRKSKLYAKVLDQRSTVDVPVISETTIKSTDALSELNELGLELGIPDPEIQEPTQRFTVSITSNMVNLVEITSNSNVMASIFPRTFSCRHCGHFEVIDTSNISSFECPCCKKLKMEYCFSCKKRVKTREGFCRICSGKTTSIHLAQESIIYVCPRCAKQIELVPKHVFDFDISFNGTFPCPDCFKKDREDIGHLHLRLGTNIGLAKWYCSNSKNCTFSDRLTRFCECGIYKVPEQEKREISLMKPVPVSAGNIISIAKSFVSIGEEGLSISLHELRNRNLDDKSKKKTTYWRMDKGNKEYDMIRKAYMIKDAFTVSGVRNTTVVYGYRSNVNVPGFNEENRLNQFIREKKDLKYNAFVLKSIGNGLVIELEPDSILRTCSDQQNRFNSPSYSSVISDCINTLRRGEFQDIIDNPKSHNLSLISCLHSINHAFLIAAIEQIGLDNLGAKILLKDCAILLHETEEIGEGGIFQLKLPDQFLRFMNRARGSLECIQDCEDACPACMFLVDAFCHPFLPQEVFRWFPPNSILDRNLGWKGLGGI